MNRRLPPGMASIVVALIIVAAFFVIRAPQPHSPGPPAAKMIISMDFGARILNVSTVKCGISVMEALRAIANVSTAYGGKFVVSINNISSDPNAQRDWFYYVNGILANVGAADYIIQPGDVIRWDYHSWKNLMVNSEVQDFPYMFSQGYGNHTRPLIVAYDAQFRNEAERIYGYMKARVDNVSLIPVQNLTEDMLKEDNVILVAILGKIVEGLNNQYLRLGWRYHMQDGYLIDTQGKKYRGAFAQITQSPFNPRGIGACENMLLLISGEEAYVGKVVDALLHSQINSFWLMEGVPA